MKNFFKRTFQTIAFLTVFLILFYFVSCIFGFKYEDGITPMDHFYDLPEDTVDVLLLGSSHMGMNVDPSILWEKYGIAAYNCWGSMQQVWNTYYYLNECLKYQSPQLVVMDVYGATFSYDYATYDNAVKNTQGLRMSKDKVDAIRASVEGDYFAQLLLGLPTYHYRYSELSVNDFQNFAWNKESGIQTINTVGEHVQSFTMPELNVGDETYPLNAKQEEYLNRIIALCREKNIPLVFVASPYYMSEMEAMRFNEIGRIAQENDVPYLNYGTDCESIGLISQEDYRDLCHMMSSGIQKYTTFLGEYMKENYDLPDRRGDENHIWNHEEDNSGNLLYELDAKFYGGNQSYLDTGIQLCVNPYDSYTILTEINTACEGEDKVWFSCYSEESGNERGIMLRRNADNFYLVFSSTETIEIPEYGETMRLAIVKEGLRYCVYLDGEFFKDAVVNLPDSYDGNLLLGCQETADGRRFRFSKTQICDLQIYSGALEENVTMNWTARELPEPPERQAQKADSDAAFELSQQFIGNGYSSYLDTGLALYAQTEDSWTLLTQFAEEPGSGAGVYFSCYAEDVSDYRGVMARRIGEGKLNLLYANRSINLDVPVGEEIRLAIVKDEVAYSIYLNGEKIVDEDYADTNPWSGDLLLGCQETTAGEKMRFSGVTVYNFEVYHGVMTEEEILSWSPEHCPEPEPRIPTPVEYTLEHSFLGDGKAAYVDSGVQLYDVEKDWCLEMTFRKNGAQTLVTCFAEDPNSYRGLIISTLDDKTLNLTLGQSAMELEMPPQPEQELKIVKQGSSYTVYLNDEYAGETTSLCPEYDGTMHIGCAVDGDGNPFRFSLAKILKLTVTDGANNKEG